MHPIAMLPTALRELFGPRTLAREPEPSMLMDDTAQAVDYRLAGEANASMSATYLFQAGQILQVLAARGCRSVVDVACGTAVQLAMVAELRPDLHFTGIDLAPAMLAQAGDHLARRGLANVTLREGDMTRLAGIADASADAVISTVAFHHLPDLDHLRRCFAAIRRILRPGGSLYLVDFGRLKAASSVLTFAHRNQALQPPGFTRDYELSLRAAFLASDFRTLARAELPGDAQVHATAICPFMVAVSTPGVTLPDPLRRRLQAARALLAAHGRADLDDMRRFFRLGGLGPDPFGGPVPAIPEPASPARAMEHAA